ncbi:MAG: hypothetical protein HY717_01120 [Planctomycetes bacterium]|nr:hypothetical protein [Planctomycetota bacterium]
MSSTEGFLLSAYLRSKGPVPYSKAARIACELLKILEKARQGGGPAPLAIHPGRIHLDARGKVDLLPEESGAAPEADRLLAYQAPEVLAGKAGDWRSALYSLGATLFELLTGRKARSGASAAEVLKEKVPELRELNPSIPVSLAAIVQSLLAGDPRARPQSPLQVLERIQQAMGYGASAGAAAPRPAAAPAPRRPRPEKTPRRTPVPEEWEEESPERYVVVKPRQRYFTYGGIAVGGMISFFLVFTALKRHDQLPKQQAQLLQAQTEAAARAVLTQRLGERRRQFEKEEKEAARHLEQKLQLKISDNMKITVLSGMVDHYFHTPSGRLMAEEVAKLRPKPQIGNPDRPPPKKQGEN